MTSIPAGESGVSGSRFLVILVRTERGTYELVPATLVPKDQLWFHSSEVGARVAEAESDFRDGRCAVAETPEEAQAFLDSLKAR